MRYHLDTLPETDLNLALRALVLRDEVRVDKLASLFGERTLATLIDAGFARRCGADEVQILIDIRPQLIAGRQQWVFSDADASMTQHVPGPDHVLGVGAASLSLLQATPVSPTGRVLDLGTGSGIQVLGQAGSATSITATDIHPRALDFAEATLVDSGIPVELLEGSWFDPVSGRDFDRIIANPPFVVGPPEIGHVYRDSGMDLDGATRLVVEQSCRHLAPGGTAHLLGAWVHSTEMSWQQRVADWLPDEGFAAWIIQRDSVTPAQYVGTWLADESLDLRSPEAAERTTAWLRHFDNAGVSGVGFGFIAIERMALSDGAVKSDISPRTCPNSSRTRSDRRSQNTSPASPGCGNRPGIPCSDPATGSAPGWRWRMSTWRMQRRAWVLSPWPNDSHAPMDHAGPMTLTGIWPRCSPG